MTSIVERNFSSNIIHFLRYLLIVKYRSSLDYLNIQTLSTCVVQMVTTL